MVAFNFKAEFVPSIQAREKKQTIRARGKKRPPIAGEPLQLYTGMRRKDCKKIIEPDPLCDAVEAISIHRDGVKVGDRWLTKKECEELAIADGFVSFSEFIDFFKSVHGLPFEGNVIRWRFTDDWTN